MNAGACIAALGNCGCAVSLLVLLYSTGAVWQPMEAHSVINMSEFRIIPGLGFCFAYCIRHRQKKALQYRQRLAKRNDGAYQ